MNNRQKVVLIIAGLLFALRLYFIPWNAEMPNGINSYLGWAPIYARPYVPGAEVEMAHGELYLSILALFIISTLLVLLFSDNRRELRQYSHPISEPQVRMPTSSTYAAQPARRIESSKKVFVTSSESFAIPPEAVFVGVDLSTNPVLVCLPPASTVENGHTLVISCVSSSLFEGHVACSTENHLFYNRERSTKAALHPDTPLRLICDGAETWYAA